MGVWLYDLLVIVTNVRYVVIYLPTGVIPGVCSTNKKQSYFATLSLIGWTL